MRLSSLAHQRSAIRGRALSYLNTFAGHSLEDFNHYCARCRALGFDYIALAPAAIDHTANSPDNADAAGSGLFHALSGIEPNGKMAEAAGRLADICKANNLGLILDAVLDHLDDDGSIARDYPDLFERTKADILDPKRSTQKSGLILARLDQPELAKRFLALWERCLGTLLTVGVTGFRFLRIDGLPAWFWQSLNGALREAFPQALLLAFTPGMSWQDIKSLRIAKFDGVFSSLPWWDLHAVWFTRELELLRGVAAVISCPKASLTQSIGKQDQKNHPFSLHAKIAAAVSDAVMIPLAIDDLADRSQTTAKYTRDIGNALQLLRCIESLTRHGDAQAFSNQETNVTALIRYDSSAHNAQKAVVILLNPDIDENHAPNISLDPIPVRGTSLGQPTSLTGNANVSAPLAPGELRVIMVKRLQPVSRKEQHSDGALEKALKAPRIIIEGVRPVIDGGKFPARSISGDVVDVAADIFVDGHGVIQAEALWKAEDEEGWRRTPMHLGDNDRWHGSFVAGRVGRYHFALEAWLDEFSSLCRDIKAKHQAGIDIAVDLKEAATLIEQAASAAAPAVREALSQRLAQLKTADQADAVSLLCATDGVETMRAAAPRLFLVRSPSMPLEVECNRAQFAAWYELFPRSTAPVEGRHGTFDDVIGRLPRIQEMGFDVLYLPPIHPIGTTNRKGRNNSLTALPDDPGSPYAIGADTGGHDAIHPQLGTLEDFRGLVAAAAQRGIEIALDFAIQCSPDHPWLKQYPQWFRWRSDGSLRFAENPPKKYEDIVNVDFYAEDVSGELWKALRDVVLFWIEQGVKIFRVDNPHTKPLPFWRWLIDDVRRRYPDVIFLSEAFTRPKMMYELAKIGFSQSYTYFTWRNTKWEITEYLQELTSEPARNFFRPHFFVNTPDINPFFLQHSGRAGFLIRAALAATLSGLWGMYSGFETCEAAALPGREEYLDAEKYEIKHRDYGASGNIIAEIATLNRLRNTQPALQTHLGLKFYNAFNDQIIVYGKAPPAHADMILVAVNLDPHNVQEATFEVPLWEWGLADDQSVEVHDLIHDQHGVWNGKLQRVRLDPAILPYAIWRIAPLAGGAA